MALIFIALLTACKYGGGRKSAADERGPHTIHAIGYVEPRDRLRRLAFEGQGVIAEITVEVGDKVKTGEELARLDSRRALADLEVARGLQSVAESELALLEAGTHPETIRVAEAALAAERSVSGYRVKQRDRLRALVERRGVSEADAEEADHLAEMGALMEELRAAELEFLKRRTREEELHLALAKVAEAKGRVRIAEANLAAMKILAPTDGEVLEMLKHAGEGISNTMPEAVLLFAPAGPLEVRAEVDEAFWGMIEGGERVIAKTAGGARAEGTVRLVKALMGTKNVFTRSATERMDLKIFETWIELPKGTDWPVGMEIAVEVYD